MDHEIQKTLITVIPTTIAALAALMSSMRNKRKIDKLHLTVNGRLNQLMEESKARAYADGFKAGKAEGCHATKKSQ